MPADCTDRVEPACIDSKRTKEELVSKLDAKKHNNINNPIHVSEHTHHKNCPVSCVRHHVELIPIQFFMAVASGGVAMPSIVLFSFAGVSCEKVVWLTAAGI